MLTFVAMNSRELFVWLNRAQARLDELLVKAESQPPGQPAKADSSRTMMLVLGGVGCAVILFCLAPICIIAILTLLGPSIGNVFSGIILDL